jgi:hypothetical protein
VGFFSRNKFLYNEEDERFTYEYKMNTKEILPADDEVIISRVRVEAVAVG